MRKWLYILTVLSMLFVFFGCGKASKSKTITIYVPDTETLCEADGTVRETAQIIFEDGWETKDSFTVRSSAGTYTATYTDKCAVTEFSENTRVEIHYDENGRPVYQMGQYEEESYVEKRELTYSYDELGRKLTEQTQTWFAGNAQPTVQLLTFTYTDTEDGSRGTASAGATTHIYTYDKRNRLICIEIIGNEQEQSRMEYTYDANGNLICSVSYNRGEFFVRSEKTFRAVEVSKETSAKLPQFRKAD